MSICAFCEKTIEAGTPSVSIVGGHFPVDDPDFFMMDESVLKERHAHRGCLLDLNPTDKAKWRRF